MCGWDKIDFCCCFLLQGHHYKLRSRAGKKHELPGNVVTSSAAKRSLNASSTVCGVVALFEQLKLLQADGFILEKWMKSIPYNYCSNDICNEYNIALPTIEETNEMACARIIRMMMSWKATYNVDKEIMLPGFKQMPMAVYSLIQKPDIAVLVGQVIILIVEVVSCTRKKAFVNTIRKVILGLVDLIRYYSLIDEKVRVMHGLVFPKPCENACVIAVKVKFKDFAFFYELRAIEISEIKDELALAYEQNKFLKHLHIGGGITQNFFIRLSQEDMKLNDSNDCEQREAKEAILFRCGQYWHKFPVTVSDHRNLTTFARWGTGIQNFISLEHKFGGFRYKAVHHNPLSVEEARLCLGDLVSKIHAALTCLHHMNFCHLDVRLENICFEEDYSVKFIDMDRARDIYMIYSDCLYDSCMYEDHFSGTALDMRQLACIVLWCTTKSLQADDYHKQTLNVDHPITRDSFFLKLWNEGNK